MDWMQFVASLVGSLAWPLALVFGLWLVRKHLGALLSRLLEVHLPGGAKAIFRGELERGREAIEKIEREKPDAPKLPAPAIELEMQVPPSDPRMKIILEYAAVEEELIKAGKVLGIRSPIAVASALLDKGLVDQNLFKVFESVRTARNLAAHGKLEVTDAEAREFAAQAEVLKLMLVPVIEVAKEVNKGKGFP